MAKKPMCLFKQSAAVPFMIRDGVTEVVLITSKSNKYWVIPKGGIGKLLSSEDSAAKEAFEEAGVLGYVSKKAFADYKYNKKSGKCHVQVYPLEVSQVLSEWDEMDKRERCIVEVRTAIGLIKKEQKGILEKFQKLLCRS